MVQVHVFTLVMCMMFVMAAQGSGLLHAELAGSHRGDGVGVSALRGQPSRGQAPDWSLQETASGPCQALGTGYQCRAGVRSSWWRGPAGHEPACRRRTQATVLTAAAGTGRWRRLRA